MKPGELHATQAMAMLPNQKHPGPGCSCRDCLQTYPDASARYPETLLDAALDRLTPKLRALDATIVQACADFPLSLESEIRALDFRSRIRKTLIELENRPCSARS